MKRIIMAMLAILTAMGAYAQNDTIRGTVIDNKKEPIPGATVQLKDCQESAVTDIDGRFMITSPCKSDKLIVNYVGFKEKKMKIKSDDMLIKLKKKGWRYAPDYYQWFVGANLLLGSLDVIGKAQHGYDYDEGKLSLGFSVLAGRVKNWGWFVKADVIPHGEASAWDLTLNGMVRLWSPIHMYIGLGVGKNKNVNWELHVPDYTNPNDYNYYYTYYYKKHTGVAGGFGWIFHHPNSKIAWNLGVNLGGEIGSYNFGFSYYFDN